jgi:DNA-binding PadR family transcriptional regulator
MKHSIHVNQKQAIELGLTNVNQAHILDLLTGASTWATPEIVDGQVYYWVSRQRISSELPLLHLKADTIYRHLKSLSEIGLIEYIKKGKKDCMRLTKKGRSYYVGNRSELAMSETNPSDEESSEIDPNHYVGNESENNSDLNPTDPTTSYISQKEDQSKRDSAPDEKLPSKRFQTEIEAKRVADYLHKRLIEEIPEAKSEKPNTWIIDIERAIRIDGRSESDLLAVIDWIHTGDKFWVSNIRSGKKLRSQFVTIVGQMRRPKTNYSKPTRRPGEFDYQREVPGERLS